MQFECAELSLVGDRDDNQDRVSVAVGERAVLMVVVDGMGATPPQPTRNAKNRLERRGMS